MKRRTSIQVWCDIGGTFTDCIVRFPTGEQRSTKVLSHGIVQSSVSQWHSDRSVSLEGRQDDVDGFWKGALLSSIDDRGNRLGDATCLEFEQGRFLLDQLLPNATHMVEIQTGLEAPVLATRLVLQVPLSQPLPALSVRLGTTRGTNALLTRRGEKVAFLTTEGFADLLEIGYQERPDLFDLNVRKRKPLYDCVVEVSERLAANGEILKPLDEDQSRESLQSLFLQGYRSLAICLVHSYCNPRHEKTAEQIAREIGFEFVACSSSIAPMIKAVARGETSVVDAYLTPVVKRYLDRVQSQFGLTDESPMLVMTSSGGLVPANQYRGKDSVLSGPAGGVVSLLAIAKASSISPLIGLDMGGTSTDVSRVDGELDVEFETVKAGVRMMIPSLKIHTVAAGGGSICWFDGVQLRVGPQSAGSNPGPACYGRGGPLTVTDLNLLAGRIDSDSFPFPLNRNSAQEALNSVLRQVNEGRLDQRMTHGSLIEGFRRIANESMASAVRTVSLSQGVDPRTHTLVSFGGAAGQHICEIATILGIPQILDPPAAGLLSALGMGMAQRQYTSSLGVYQTTHQLLAEWLKVATQTLSQDLRSQAAHDTESQWEPTAIRIEARYVGADGTLSVTWKESSWNRRLFEDLFHQLHRQRFGYDRMNRAIEVTVVHALLRSTPTNQLPTTHFPCTTEPLQTSGSPIDRRSMTIGASYAGPLLIRSDGSTTFVDRGWFATVLADRTLCLKCETLPDSFSHREDSKLDPVLREVLAKRFAAIAEQMGTVLEQTAISVNVKERRDFSCAVFNAKGDLIANAPHVPVHLGAMSATVKQMMLEFPDVHAGDCFITNDPYRGGSHLPDVTVITPVFGDETNVARSPDFFVACRAHHAEIGGIAPGSMAPHSQTLADEGVLIPPMYLARSGVDLSREIEERLTKAKYPTRAPRENLADIAAQQASNQFGMTALKELAHSYSVSQLQNYMEFIQQASQRKTELWIESLPFVERSFEDFMDDGTRIAVTIRKLKDRAGSNRLQVDFTGTGSESKGNLNANPAIASAAVLYVVRCAIADDLPLNSGVMRCIDLIVPPGILNPQKMHSAGIDLDDEGACWPAVAGGNVETSQRVVDCLLGALGLAASSQGTMNNLLFGDGTFGYYETICGGAGATPTSDGESAVHTHMTNTRLTDVEILEKRCPVQLMEFAVRKGSGGTGIHAGGCGIIRQIKALRPLAVSLVTSRRGAYPPIGLKGGGAGAIGENWFIQKDGQRIRLPSSTQLDLEAGDSIRLLTPGGGGFGTPPTALP